MRDIARLSEKDKKALFHNTAAKMGMTDAIIEKDFWVCYMLDYLFHRCAWKNNIAFKGGTSLSKSYGLIERFSEVFSVMKRTSRGKSEAIQNKIFLTRKPARKPKLF